MGPKIQYKINIKYMDYMDYITKYIKIYWNILKQDLILVKLFNNIRLWAPWAHGPIWDPGTAGEPQQTAGEPQRTAGEQRMNKC